jgi:hypothetical protein
MPAAAAKVALRFFITATREVLVGSAVLALRGEEVWNLALRVLSNFIVVPACVGAVTDDSAAFTWLFAGTIDGEMACMITGVAEQGGVGAASWSVLIFAVFGGMAWFYAEFAGGRGRHRVLTVSDQRGLQSSLQVRGCEFEGFGDFFKAAAVFA